MRNTKCIIATRCGGQVGFANATHESMDAKMLVTMVSLGEPMVQNTPYYIVLVLSLMIYVVVIYVVLILIIHIFLKDMNFRP
jgi:hypothetical protein